MAAQAGSCLAWSETPEDTFCRVVAHIKDYLRSHYCIDSSIETLLKGIRESVVFCLA